TLAAAGWDGDRYAVFKDPDGKLGLVWFTNWDSPEDAQEFAGAYSQYLSTKVDPAATTAVKESKPPTVPERFRLERAGRVYQILRHDSDVVVLEGFSETETEALAPAVFQAQKKPKE
ncbi:MAG: hypothetical protein HY000_04040, partial [Planctomycetes bacterium]|nr:hypothetical protein [Planctomycetota bacterium]